MATTSKHCLTLKFERLETSNIAAVAAMMTLMNDGREAIKITIKR